MRHATEIDKKLLAVREILVRRIGRKPLPTASSFIDEGLSKAYEQSETSPFIAIAVPQPQGVPIRLGIVLSHLLKSNLTAKYILDAISSAERFMLNSLLIPVTEEIDSEVIEMVHERPQLRLIQIAAARTSRNFSAESFDFMAGVDLAVLSSANLICQEIIKNLRKISHITLSDIAAPIYDESYKSASAGTKFVMDREEEILKGLIGSLDKKRTLVELGCGTGRHTLMLASQFERAYGYDFSSGMIGIAREKKKQTTGEVFSESDLRVDFSVRDVEMYPLQRDDFDRPVDCILGLFGMGSFVENLGALIMKCENLLEDGGVCAFSFYNSEALNYKFPPPWRYTSLSASLDNERQELRVNLPNRQSFFIFCRPYNYNELLEAFSSYFSHIKIRSFPAIAGVMPPEYIGAAGKLTELQELIFEADRLLETSKFGHAGNYFFVSGVKPTYDVSILFDFFVEGQFNTDLYIDYLRGCRGLEFSVVDHKSVRNANDAASVFGSEIPYLKTIIGFVPAKNSEIGPSPVLFVLTGQDKIDRAKVSKVLVPEFASWRIANSEKVSAIIGSSEYPLPFLGG